MSTINAAHPDHAAASGEGSGAILVATIHGTGATPVPAPSRGRGLLGLAEDALGLLETWRVQYPSGIAGDTRAVVRTLAAEVGRAVARAERESAAAHAKGLPVEADVARRLGVSASTLARYRARRRRDAAE